MPYADKNQQREAQKEWWKEEYHSSLTFRRKELKRKKEARAGWSPKRRVKNGEYMKTYMRGYRARLAAAKKKRGKAA